MSDDGQHTIDTRTGFDWMTSGADMESTENRSDVLRLEYACTPAERKEAESFVLAQTLGGGSKRRANAKLLLILIAFICLVVLFVVTVIPKEFAPYMIAGWVGLTGVMIVLHRRARRKLERKLETSPPIRVELSAQGFRIDDTAEKSQMMIPWDSFRRFESESIFVFQHRTSGRGERRDCYARRCRKPASACSCSRVTGSRGQLL